MWPYLPGHHPSPGEDHGSQPLAHQHQERKLQTLRGKQPGQSKRLGREVKQRGEEVQRDPFTLPNSHPSLGCRRCQKRKPRGGGRISGNSSSSSLALPGWVSVNISLVLPHARRCTDLLNCLSHAIYSRGLCNCKGEDGQEWWAGRDRVDGMQPK